MHAVSFASMIGLAIISAAVSSGQSTASAVIVNSGSTNRSGYRITVDKSGSAKYVAIPRGVAAQKGVPMEARERTIPEALAQRFYADVAAARPFSSLPEIPCAKSASFGSVLRIEFGGAQTPDLSCGDGGNDKLKALIQDTGEITKIMTAQ